MKTKQINKLISIITTLEKQANNTFIVWYNEYGYSGDVYMFNEYAVIKVPAGVYVLIENKRATLPALHVLMEAAKQGQACFYNFETGKTNASDISENTINSIQYCFTSEHDETTDTNLTFYKHCDTWHNTPPLHYFVNSDYVIAVNDILHTAIMRFCEECNSYPYFYSTTDIKAVTYETIGMTAAVLPIRINQNDTLPETIRSMYKFQCLTA